VIQQAFEYARLSSWPCLKLRTIKILKSGWRGWKRVGFMVTESVKAVGVLHLELLTCQVSMVSAAN